MAHYSHYQPWDEYRVLPHRDVLDCSLYAADGTLLHADYEHVSCGMDLKRGDIMDNWCVHCAKPLNKAAKKRALAALFQTGRA